MALVRTPATFPLNTITRESSDALDQTFITFLNTLETNAIARQQFIAPLPVKVPSVFEGRRMWARYLSAVKNQGSCGGCYAFAATSALADRYNLRSKGLLHVNLSAARIIQCDTIGNVPDNYAVGAEKLHSEAIQEATTLFGCNGNTLLEAWRFLFNLGTNTTDCVPDYPIEKTCSELVGPFYDTCENISPQTPAVFFRATHIYVVPGTERDGGSEQSIRENIFHYGPISTAMDIYENFYTFDPKREIYRTKSGKRTGGHAVVIDGWGEERGIPFWWVRNSWGSTWGLDGYFKIERGTNCCHIEENIIVGAPVMESSEQQLEMPESILDLLYLPMVSLIRRVLTSTFIPNGGMDPRTSVSRRYLSKAQTSDLPVLRWYRLQPDRHFVAGIIQQSPTFMTLFFSILLGIIFLLLSIIGFLQINE